MPFEHATHQTCVAHLLRRCRKPIGDLDHDGDAFLRHRLVAFINDVANRI